MLDVSRFTGCSKFRKPMRAVAAKKKVNSNEAKAECSTMRAPFCFGTVSVGDENGFAPCSCEYHDKEILKQL